MKRTAASVPSGRWNVRPASIVAALVAFLVVCLLPGLAWAQEVEKASALGRLGDALFDIVTPILVSTVGVLASWALFKLKQRLGLQVSEATAKQWADLCEQAVLRAAEWARKRSKELNNVEIPGPAVLEVALNWVIDIAKSMGLPEKSREALAGLIEARLFELRREQEIENKMTRSPSGDPFQAPGETPPQTV